MNKINKWGKWTKSEELKTNNTLLKFAFELRLFANWEFHLLACFWRCEYAGETIESERVIALFASGCVHKLYNIIPYSTRPIHYLYSIYCL